EKMSAIGRILNQYAESLEAEERLSFQKELDAKMQEVQEEIAKETEKTVIQKIAISGMSIEHAASGEVPGNVLNQFSMDEFEGNLRIATTTNNWQAASKNHVYILDENLNIIGKLEDLAQGERIFSARFLGSRAYLVTFRQIDPLFVIDLGPAAPRVLGFLKIPGVSDYLHPYDDNHVIGVGRDATEEGRILGLKLSLFDASDPANPREVSKYIIGEQGTSSEALNDHKAFLFNKEKQLLVIPVTEYAYRESGMEWSQKYGAYVFNINLEDGLTLKGIVPHGDTEHRVVDSYFYSNPVRRSLYMDDVLYTISQALIKANALGDLGELSEISLAA
ncbi:MAG: beta-propeller domain-containing protein, partial [Candidatus Aenigmarchaeota archaeon]|nr:beta-propeller domain-containing protein [Candidatus Aenigmarchaeota archaeon]